MENRHFPQNIEVTGSDDVEVSATEPRTNEPNKHVKEFCASVKKRSLEETSGGVAYRYREQNLIEPETEYTPQLKKIKFYRGDWVPHTKEYVKEKIFTTCNSGETRISKNQILQFLWNQGEQQNMETQRYKAIVGQAGSGKTTLMKRLARDVIHGKLLIQKGQNEPFEPDLVHYLNIRDIPVTNNEMKKINPCDLLFGQVLAELDEDALEHGFKWLRKNQKKAVFFLDGLDQATWSLQGDSNPIKYEDKASTSTIMENLLKGNLFPNVLIIISSREHALSPLTGNLRPHEIIGLAGFTMEDRKQVFIGLAGEDGENLWNILRTKSPALVPLVSIPIFLVYIVIVYKVSQNPPDTMSGVIIKILQIFLHSEQVQERENIMEILKGLKQMSFKGTEEGRVLFTHKDLEEFNLIPKKVRDLVVSVPGSTLLSQNLMKGDFRLFFCHQSIQELLSALSIIEKDLEEFTKFVNESLHQDHWSAVRRFVCGVLMNEETYNEAKGQDLIHVSGFNKKRQILKQSLREQTSTGQQYRQQLELFASLYESNDSEFIQSNVHEINIEGQSPTPNDMHVISSVLSRCSQVELVRLVNCNLNLETIEILNAGLQTSQLKIKTLDVSVNNNMETDGCKAIGAIVHRCQVEELKIWKCNLSSDEIKGLQVDLANSKMKILDVSWNDNMGTDGCKTIGAIVHRCQVEDLNMSGCNLSTNEIICLQEGLENSKMKILDVSWNDNMETDGCKTIGAIVHRCQVEDLKMTGCNLSTDKIKGLLEGLANSQIKILDVSSNENMGTDGCKTIGAIVHRCQVEELNMSKCNLSTLEINGLQEGLDNSKIKILDVSFNQSLGADDCKTIGAIVHKCQVQELNMSDCELSSDKIKGLKEDLANSKIKVLDVSNNENLETDGCKTIGAIVHRCQVEDLNMSKCNLSTDNVKGLQEGLDKSKIKILNVSNNENMGADGCKTIGAIVYRCEVEDLKMSRCNLSKDKIIDLQKRLANSKLKILKYSLPFKHTLNDVHEIADLIRQCHLRKFVLWDSSDLSSSEIDLIRRKARDTEVILE